MQVKLTPKEIRAIEKALNGNGAPEAVVRVENGAVSVFKTKREKVSA